MIKVFEKLESKLKELELDEEKVKDIIEFSKKEIPKDFVPSDELSKKKDELSQLQEKLEQTNNQIKELSETTESAEEYKEKLEELNNEYDEYKQQQETQLANIKKKHYLKDSLLEQGADKDNIDLLMNDFDVDDMKWKEDKIVGIDEYVNEDYKTKRSRLFEKEVVEGGGEPEKGNPANNDLQEENKMREVMGLPTK